MATKPWAQMTNRERRETAAAQAHELRKTESDAKTRGQMRAVIRQVAGREEGRNR